jgi:hypothetical protein
MPPSQNATTALPLFPLGTVLLPGALLARQKPLLRLELIGDRGGPRKALASAWGIVIWQPRPPAARKLLK